MSNNKADREASAFIFSKKGCELHEKINCGDISANKLMRTVWLEACAHKDNEIADVHQDMAIQMDLIHNYKVEVAALEAKNKQLIEAITEFVERMHAISDRVPNAEKDKAEAGIAFHKLEKALASQPTEKDEYLMSKLECIGSQDWCEHRSQWVFEDLDSKESRRVYVLKQP